MNLLHMKYALEVAKAGSVNKAAEELLIAQPNLSRAIKELEQSLGIAIFDRSARGMRLTPDGEVFVNYAGSILKQVDEVEELFQTGAVSKERFSISVPRASYISEAFTRFSQCLMDVPKIEVFYKETNALRALNNVLQEDYKLGIVRYAEEFDRYYKSMMDAKDLNYELVTEFQYVLIMSRNNPLARLKTITYDDLSDYIEIAHADPFVPSLPMSEVKRVELPDTVNRRIFVFERASQFELLSNNERTFMWVSPVPNAHLEHYGLVQRVCGENERAYKDVMIYRKNYALSRLDNLFITKLCEAKREIMN